MTEHSSDYLKTAEEIRWKRKDGLYVKPQSAAELKEWYKETKSKKFFDNANDLFWNQYKKYFIYGRVILVLGIMLMLYSIFAQDEVFQFWYLRIIFCFIGLIILAFGIVKLYFCKKYGINRFEWYKTAFANFPKASKINQKKLNDKLYDDEQVQQILNFAQANNNLEAIAKNLIYKYELRFKNNWKKQIFELFYLLLSLHIN
ncbi:hypothetical protein [Mycoplasma buteonis]|uniref:hypothetical protein n=1 Tax=Mycoplasma buteonis TaxID=171280 RepID=UPI0005669B1C|nr:hypothetical protein [Mycoplasma buteonis]